MSDSGSERDQVVARLRAAGFTPAAAERGAEALRPVVGVGFEPGPAPLGGSKVGGRPHLPTSVEWPGDLAFVAQINFAECQPFDFTGTLPSDGMMYLFSTCEEGDVGEGDEDDFVLRYFPGPPSGLTVVDFPEELDAVEGQFVERRMIFSRSYVRAPEDELDAGRPDGRDDDALAAVDGTTSGARMLGRPDFFRPELDDAFDAEVDTLLLNVSGMCLWRGADDQASIYGDGEFFVIVGTDDLRGGKIDEGWILFESGT